MKEVPSVSRRYLRTKAAAEYCGLSQSLFEKLRLTGKGSPAYSKMGRAVIYDVVDLDAWLSARKRLSTSEPARVA
jgi:predicted DNA-binding transcriptional regulator AlpA